MGDEAKKVNNVFRVGVKNIFPRVDWQRIENWSGPGVPDVNFCLYGKDYWVECKWVPSVKGARFSHPLNREQCSWLLRRVRAGGSAWVLARRVDTFKLWHGSFARELVDNGWNAKGETLTLESPWDWGYLIDQMYNRK